MKKILRLFLLLLLCSKAYGQSWNYPKQKPWLGLEVDWTHPQSKDLIGFWPFNEGSGNKVYDLSGNWNTGTFQGTAPSWSAGKFGSAVLLPGTDEYINCGTKIGDTLGTTNIFSVSIWFKADVAGGSQGLWNLGPFAGARGEALVFITGNNLYLQLNDNNYTGSFAFTDVGWNHLAVSWDGVRVRVYLNSINKIDDAYSTAIAATGLKFIIGGTHDAAFTFIGKIDNCSVYNRALSAFEIAKLHAEPFCFMRPSWDWLLYGGISAPAVGAPQVIFIY